MLNNVFNQSKGVYMEGIFMVMTLKVCIIGGVIILCISKMLIVLESKKTWLP